MNGAGVGRSAASSSSNSFGGFQHLQKSAQGHSPPPKGSQGHSPPPRPPSGDVRFNLELEVWQGFAQPAAWMRALKLRLRDGGADAFVALAMTLPRGGDMQADFAAMRKAFLREHEACYVLFLAAPLSNLWALFTFVPDAAPPRDLALYQAGAEPLVRLLGGAERVPWHEEWHALGDVVFGQHSPPKGPPAAAPPDANGDANGDGGGEGRVRLQPKKASAGGSSFRPHLLCLAHGNLA